MTLVWLGLVFLVAIESYLHDRRIDRKMREIMDDIKRERKHARCR